MHPSSSSSQPPDHPKHPPPPPPPPPAMGYPAPPSGPTYFGAAPPSNGHAPPFGVAYPHPAPPHHPHPPPYHHYPPPPPPHHHHHHHPYPPLPPPPTCLRRLLAFFVAGFLLLGAVIFVIWLLVRPRAPGFSLATLSVSNLSSTNSTLSASFAVSLVSSNPNSKLSVSYFSSIASVSLTPSSPLAVVSLPPFSLAPHNTTTLSFRLAIEGEYVGPDAAAELARGSGVVEFQVRVLAVAVFEQGGWRTRRRVVRVMCGGVPVAFRVKNATAAAFDGPPRPCYVGM